MRWDRTIRSQIKACALFLPVISANTHERTEGYFRLEWKLAIERSYRMAPDQTLLVPVAIDGTHADERMPEQFRELHWVRLPGGEPSIAFVDRVRRLLSSDAATATVSMPRSGSEIAGTRPRPPPPLRSAKSALSAIGALLCLAALGYFAA
ncbi:MAG: hypothetical protein ACRDQZ_03850, partial [Mycobacteriales bacterium]